MEKFNEILKILREMHPDAGCELKFDNAFELLVAVILSAQCTDKRVNQITDKLFKVYSTPKQFAELSAEELERYIYSAGFYHNKAKNIIEASKDIVNVFQGKVPDNLNDLQKLAGVGRKTANVVYAEAFKGAAIAVDTHVFRVANRLGLADAKTPEKTEIQLMENIPEKYWSEAHHLLLFHGRYVCKSKKPDCENCKLKLLCKNYIIRREQ